MSLTALDTQPHLPANGPPIYRPQDYVGAFRHMLIFAVDASVLLILAFPIAALALLFETAQPVVARMLALTGPLCFSWFYLTVLKPSRFRSPGYWIADAKIVTIDGQQPSPLCMSLRLAWTIQWLFGSPVFFVLDLWWTTMNDERQMLRDLFAQTRLIRNRAKPVGFGRVSFVLHTGYGITLMYARVVASAVTSATSPRDREAVTAASSPLPEQGSITTGTGSRDNLIVQCPSCGIHVIPKANGLCPSCQTEIVRRP